jgi:hypothetical protein
VSECMCRVRGVRGGGCSPHLGVRGKRPEFFFFLPREMCHVFRWFFGTWFLPMVFYFG